MFKILDKRNGEVTAEQQAVFNKISTNNADGYVDGFLNSLRIAKMSSNVISIDSGLLSIQGFRSVNDTLTTYTVSVTPSEPIPFQLVATYSHFISDENDTLVITTRPTQELRREPLFAGQNAVYEVELAEFNMTADGIADFNVTLEKIVYNEQDLSELLDKVTKAEQDSSTALEKVTELETQVIEKQGTAVYVGGEAQSRVNFTSDPQTQIAEAQSDISDIVSGAQTVGKATRDANGNVIDTTYAKLSQVVRIDEAQSLTDEQKQQAQNNIYPVVTDLNSVPVPFTRSTQIFSFSVNTSNAPTTDGGTLIQSVYDTFNGGFYTQTAIINTEGGGEIYTRRHNGSNGFTNWQRYMSIDPTTLAPSTANGWTQTTKTGTLPSAGVYMVAYNFLPSDSQPTYYNPAILVYDGTVGSCTVTDDTGLLLHSIVVKPSGIQLNDPVHPGSLTQSANIYYKRIA